MLLLNEGKPLNQKSSKNIQVYKKETNLQERYKPVHLLLYVTSSFCFSY